MTAKQSYVALGTAMCLMTLGSTPSLVGSLPDSNSIIVRFSGSDAPTGVFYDWGNFQTAAPDADGIVRIRGVLLADALTVSIPELGVSNLQLQAKMGLNADLKATDGTGECWGTLEASLGSQRVLEGYWYGVRVKKSDQLWVGNCELSCVFCAGDLEGVLLRGTEIHQTWTKFMDTGFAGTSEGTLIIPNSLGITPPSDLLATNLLHLASRARFGTGIETHILGFDVRGTAPKTFLIRGVGPTLAAYGVTSALVDSTITVYNARGNTIASNDNWPTQTTGAATSLSDAASRVGAFALPAGSKDAALLITLDPGSYSVAIGSVGGANGIGLLEVYEVQ